MVRLQGFLGVFKVYDDLVKCSIITMMN